MSWSITDLIPQWGDSGEKPSDNKDYSGGDQVNEKHFNYLWWAVGQLEDEIRSALTDIDSDADGVVDEADSANAYKGNDIDSDGDGVVDEADSANAYKGNDIDTDGDGVVDEADDAENVTGTYKGNDIDRDGDGTVDDADQYDGTAPSDGSADEFLKTDGSTTLWDTVSPSEWNGNSILLSPDGPEIGIDVDRIQNKDYKEDHVVDTTNGYDFTSISYSGDDLDASSSGNGTSGVAFSDDGTAAFTCEEDTGDIAEYTLSTAWDVTTASFNQDVDISGTESTPKDIAFNDDGTKIFIAGGDAVSVHEYTLSSAYDITTISHNRSLDVSSEGSIPVALTFNGDGSEVYAVLFNDEIVQSYSLGSAYDLSNATPNNSFDISSEGSGGGGVTFDDDGSHLLITSGNTEDTIYEYALSAPYDISTASYTGDPYDISSEDSHDDPTGLAWGDSGTKLFVSSSVTSDIHVYDSDASHTIDLAASNVHKVTLQADATFSFSGVNESESNQATLYLKQDSTGSRTPSWPSSVRWPEGEEPSWSTSGGAVDVVTFLYDPDDDAWDGFVGGFNFS